MQEAFACAWIIGSSSLSLSPTSSFLPLLPPPPNTHRFIVDSSVWEYSLRGVKLWLILQEQWYSHASLFQAIRSHPLLLLPHTEPGTCLPGHHLRPLYSGYTHSMFNGVQQTWLSRFKQSPVRARRGLPVWATNNRWLPVVDTPAHHNQKQPF